jgi:hypothetical protein
MGEYHVLPGRFLSAFQLHEPDGGGDREGQPFTPGHPGRDRQNQGRVPSTREGDDTRRPGNRWQHCLFQRCKWREPGGVGGQRRYPGINSQDTIGRHFEGGQPGHWLLAAIAKKQQRRAASPALLRNGKDLDRVID